MKMKRWVTAAPDAGTVRSLAAACGFSPLAAAALCARGVENPAQAQAFLCDDPASLHDPLLLPDMEPLDLFPGLLVRTELLHALGEYERNLKEIAVMFGERMAAITGTLWEHIKGHASLNHGIASAIACIITESLEKLGK